MKRIEHFRPDFAFEGQDSKHWLRVQIPKRAVCRNHDNMQRRDEWTRRTGLGCAGGMP